jgi:ABC-type multidrug transport system fused ATPase/permease subunit
MRHILNLMTYVMLLCLAITTLLGLMVFQNFLLGEVIERFPHSLQYEVHFNLILWAGVMFIQSVIIHYIYSFWKTHIRLEK